MSLNTSITLTTAALLSVVSVVPVAGQTLRDLETKVERLEKSNAQLRRQTLSLQSSLADANRSERESATALATIKTRLEALDRSVFGTKDEDLIEAITSVEHLTERNQEIELAARELVSNIQLYLSTAIAADPDLRLQVEESIRNLDSTVGLRHKPRPNVAIGTLKDANVVTIDSESGMLVLNIGHDAGARIGMTFSLRRGDQTLGEATLVDVRSTVSGAFVDNLNDPNLSIRPGDAVSVITQSN